MSIGSHFFVYQCFLIVEEIRILDAQCASWPCSLEARRIGVALAPTGSRTGSDSVPTAVIRMFKKNYSIKINSLFVKISRKVNLDTKSSLLEFHI